MNAAKRMKLIRRRKRRSFLSLFLRRFIPGLLICAAIVLVGSDVFSEVIDSTVRETIYSNSDMIRSRADKIKSLYDGKNDFERLKAMLYLFSGGDKYEDNYDEQHIYSLYDPEEGKELYRTTEVMLAWVPSGKKTEPPRYYSCDIDVLGDLYYRRKELAESKENIKFGKKIYYYDIYADDIYVNKDGKTFLGRVNLGRKLWTNVEADYEVVETRDLTPADTTGMEHILFDDSGFCRLHGADEDSIAADWLEQSIPQCFEENYQDVYPIDIGEWVIIKSTQIKLNDGKEYIGVEVFYMSIHVAYIKIIIISSAVIFAVMLLISLLLAYMRYVNEQAHYAVEDSRREMTNAMAHDLKSPLMAISGCAENMKNGVMPEKSQHYSELILSNVEYMNSIIANVLDLAKTEDLGKLKKSDTYLRDITENALSKYTDILSERGITAEITGEAVIKADSTLMMQAIENLVSNAVKYTPDNGRIDIRISSRKYIIKNDNSENTGKSADELWKPFIKGDNSRTAKLGSGLGLSIVKNICEKHRFRTKLDTSGGVFSVTIIFVL